MPDTQTNDRIAFRMKLKPGSLEQYKARHDRIWPELKEAFVAAGIHDYSIFLDEATLDLFAVQKRSDPLLPQALATSLLMKSWWVSMTDLMECNPDCSPQRSNLVEVFRLE